MRQATAWFYRIMVGVFAIGIILMAVGPHVLYVGSLIEKLGDAFLIAGILSVGVDQYVKHRLAEEVANDVLSFALGYPLPDRMREEIHYVLRLPYVREDFEMQIALSRVEGHAGFVRAEMKTFFRVMNLSELPQDYPFRSRIAPSSYPSVGQNDILGVSYASEKALDGKTLKGKIHLTDGEREFQTTVHLPPRSSNERISFWTHRTGIFKEEDTYILDILEPSMGITIRVDESSGFKWNIHFPLHGKAERIPEDKPDRWEHHGVFLPGQHVKISWTHRSGG